MSLRIGVVGIGKIARDQHIPALLAEPQYELVATASRSGASVPGAAAFTDIAEMLAAGLELDAVSLCTPPRGRDAAALMALDAGLHVMLEKPPGTTVAEIDALAARAREQGVSLFATWHSREASGVGAARTWLANKAVRSVRIVWREDIRQWHPGQDWILEEGGFGVFDAGINALSIATEILTDALIFETARIVVPQGRASPIAAHMSMSTGGAQVVAEFDFREMGSPIWDIVVETDAGTLRLERGGEDLHIGDANPVAGEAREYPRLYARFADLIAARAIDADTTPLELVLAALATGERISTEPFAF